MQLNPYLNFNGDCETAFKFYEQCLGGRITMMSTYAGTPAEGHVPPEWRSKIIHARLVSDDIILMGSDAPPNGQGGYEQPKGFSVALGFNKLAEAERVLRGTCGQRNSADADGQNVLCRALRNADRPLRYPLDRCLRESGLTGLLSEHDLLRKPVATFRDHAYSAAIAEAASGSRWRSLGATSCMNNCIERARFSRIA